MVIRTIKMFFICFGVLGLISIILFFIILWPVDSNLQGTFISDKEKTIQYLKSSGEIHDKDKEIDTLNQMFGHLSLDFEGHKILWKKERFEIKDYPVEGETFLNESSSEVYYFLSWSNENITNLIILPSPIWNLDEIRIVPVEFEADGFWMIANHPLGMKTIKERFVRNENTGVSP